MNQLFDIACNFTHESFNDDLNKVIDDGLANGVNRFLVVAAELDDAEKINKLILQHDDFFCFTTGVHPHHAKSFNSDSSDRMRELIKKYSPNALGEMGLDFFRNLSSHDEQVFAFAEQIKLAIEFNKPLFLHQRDAHESFIKVLNTYKADIDKAVVHCFTGTQLELDDYIECDFYIGLTGWICDERRNKDLRASIKNIPLNRLMLETDSPYLIPRNLKPKPKSNRNEPKNLMHIASEIAGLRSESIEEICNATYQNSLDFFNQV
jgi:TatD DNase family protein|tara:strand:- start:4153 stop:4944 length:792 start_codon:yes stop_codon:yes gene_type:complete